MANFYGGPRGLTGPSGGIWKPSIEGRDLVWTKFRDDNSEDTTEEPIKIKNWLDIVSFKIAATFESFEAMNTNTNIEEYKNKFVMIIISKEDNPETNSYHGKVYYSNGIEFEEIGDLKASIPYIKDGNWYVDGNDTRQKAQGEQGFSIYAYSKNMEDLSGTRPPEGEYDAQYIISLGTRVLQIGDLLIDIVGNVYRVTSFYKDTSTFDAIFVTNIHGEAGDPGSKGDTGPYYTPFVEGNNLKGILSSDDSTIDIYPGFIDKLSTFQIVKTYNTYEEIEQDSEKIANTFVMITSEDEELSGSLYYIDSEKEIFYVGRIGNGELGYYYPNLTEDGMLSWEKKTGEELEEAPIPINIKGQTGKDGTSFELVGFFADETKLPEDKTSLIGKYVAIGAKDVPYRFYYINQDGTLVDMGLPSTLGEAYANNELANALKVAKQGTNLLEINDISPLPHTVKGKIEALGSSLRSGYMVSSGIQGDAKLYLSGLKNWIILHNSEKGAEHKDVLNFQVWISEHLEPNKNYILTVKASSNLSDITFKFNEEYLESDSLEIPLNWQEKEIKFKVKDNYESENINNDWLFQVDIDQSSYTSYSQTTIYVDIKPDFKVALGAISVEQNGIDVPVNTDGSFEFIGGNIKPLVVKYKGIEKAIFTINYNQDTNEFLKESLKNDLRGKASLYPTSQSQKVSYVKKGLQLIKASLNKENIYNCSFSIFGSNLFNINAIDSTKDVENNYDGSVLVKTFASSVGSLRNIIPGLMFAKEGDTYYLNALYENYGDLIKEDVGNRIMIRAKNSDNIYINQEWVFGAGKRITFDYNSYLENSSSLLYLPSTYEATVYLYSPYGNDANISKKIWDIRINKGVTEDYSPFWSETIEFTGNLSVERYITAPEEELYFMTDSLNNYNDVNISIEYSKDITKSFEALQSQLY